MNNNTIKPPVLFTPSGCLTGEALILFVSESLNGAELATAEQHIAECALCADAADGLRLWLRENNTGEPLKNFQTRTDLINNRIKQRIHSNEFVETTQIKRLSDRPYVWFAAAAAIILLMGIGFVFWIQNQNSAKMQAQRQLKKKEAAFIAQIPEALAYPPSNSKVILNVKYNSKKGAHVPPTVTIVNDDIAMGLERLRPGRNNTGKTNDETEYTETRQGVESDDYREESGVYKGQNSTRSLPARNSGGATKKSETDEETSSVFISVQQMPSFPGGDAARRKYLAKNLRYPARAAENGIQGSVIVSFLVNSDGKIEDVKILHGIGGGCDEEALRVVKFMPRWNPGYLNGKKVDVLFTMPVNFKLR